MVNAKLDVFRVFVGNGVPDLAEFVARFHTLNDAQLFQTVQDIQHGHAVASLFSPMPQSQAKQLAAQFVSDF